MKITIESTSKIVHLDGVPARVWEGETDTGIPVICFVTRIAVSREAGYEAHERFERELKEQRPPSAEAESFPSRLIL